MQLHDLVGQLSDCNYMIQGVDLVELARDPHLVSRAVENIINIHSLNHGWHTRYLLYAIVLLLELFLQS